MQLSVHRVKPRLLLVRKLARAFVNKCFKELQDKGEHPVYEDVLRDVNDRDYRDTHRAESPLRQAEDAIVVDNSNLTREQQMEVIYDLFDRHQ